MSGIVEREVRVAVSKAVEASTTKMLAQVHEAQQRSYRKIEREYAGVRDYVAKKRADLDQVSVTINPPSTPATSFVVTSSGGGLDPAFARSLSVSRFADPNYSLIGVGASSDIGKLTLPSSEVIFGQTNSFVAQTMLVSPKLTVEPCVLGKLQWVSDSSGNTTGKCESPPEFFTIKDGKVVFK